MNIRAFLILFFCLAFVGCTSPEQYAAQRRERMLAAYPPGSTTRADVQKRLSYRQPDLSETRPASGWSASSQAGAPVAESERRTGSPVYRCERYLEPDGLFGLCWYWFYYDDQDRLVDAEWQWHTD